jgi:hypothetical protein
MLNLKFWSVLTGATFLLMPVFGILYFWTKSALNWKLLVTDVLIFVFSVIMYNVLKK